MRNLLALIGLVVVVVGGLGWYLGWYQLTFTRTPDGNLQIKTDVDTKKVVNDTNDGLKKVGSAIGDQLDKAAQDAKAAQPGPPGNTPGPITPPAGTNTDGGWLFGPGFTPNAGK